MIFLAQIEYSVMHYEGKVERCTDTKLVYAETADEAELKATSHYSNKSRDYDVYYSVHHVEIDEPIL